jgi:hypothetical protein
LSKILTVDHHAIHSVGRELYRELASIGAHKVKVLAPIGEHGITTLKRNDVGLISSHLLLCGKTHRNIIHGLAGSSGRFVQTRFGEFGTEGRHYKR